MKQFFWKQMIARVCMPKAEMMTVSMRKLRRKRILIDFRIKNEKSVINLSEHQVKSKIMRLKTKKPLINLKEVDIIGVKKN